MYRRGKWFVKKIAALHNAGERRRNLSPQTRYWFRFAHRNAGSCTESALRVEHSHFGISHIHIPNAITLPSTGPARSVPTTKAFNNDSARIQLVCLHRLIMIVIIIYIIVILLTHIGGAQEGGPLNGRYVLSLFC